MKSEPGEDPKIIREPNDLEEPDEFETLKMVEDVKKRPYWHLTLAEALFYGLIILAVVGVAITRTSVELGRVYWLSMIPLIAAASLYVEWSRARGKGINWRTLLRTQLLHWISLIVAIELVYGLFGLGQLDRVTIGSIVLLLIAQTTFAVGVYVDWRFTVVGLFLAGCLIVISYLQVYFWIVAIIAFALIGLAMYLHRKFNIS